MTSLDYIVIACYLIMVLSIGFWVKENHLEGYLANSRATKFLPLLLSTTASWVGAGAIIGVSSESYKTGISYGLTVILVNAVFMGLFAYFAPRIKKRGDELSAYTVGEFMGSYYGSRVQFVVSLVYFSVGAIWCAIQLLAIAQLTTVLFSTSLTSGLIFSLIVSLSYTLVGGLKSDIITDVMQFVVMFIGFLIMIPIIVLKQGDANFFNNLSPSFFDPVAFGGPVFLVGSLIMGALYPLINVHEWQKVYSAVDPHVARKAYLYSIPLCVTFVSLSIFIGLFGASQFKGTQSDQLFFRVIIEYMPNGIRGLCLASLLALVMSSVDSILIAGSSCLGRDILPFVLRRQTQNSRVFRYRLFSLIFGLISLALAILVPGIVSLSLYAVFISIAVSPAILASLINPKYSEKQILTSIGMGLIGLILFYPVLGKIVFLVEVLLAGLPFVVHRFTMKSGKGSDRQGIN